MRVSKLFILCINSGEPLILQKSCRGLFYKYAGRAGVAEIEWWVYERDGKNKDKNKRWKLEARWSNGQVTDSKNKQVDTSFIEEEFSEKAFYVKSPEEVEAANLRMGESVDRIKNLSAENNAGAIVVSHGSIGSIASRKPGEIAEIIASKAQEMDWPVFRKTVLEVCWSGKPAPDPSQVDMERTPAEMFLNAYSKSEHVVDKGMVGSSLLIAGYDSAVSVAYGGKPDRPGSDLDYIDSDAVEEEDVSRRVDYGRKYQQNRHAVTKAVLPSVWMAPNRASVKKVFNYVVTKDKNKMVTSLELDGWSDRK